MLKLTLIGGGSSYTPEFVEGLLDRYDRFPLDELWLLDIKDGKEKQDIVFELAKRMIEKSGKNIKIFATLDKEEAIKDADYVCTQMRVGLLDARIRNEKLAANFGMIGQETNSITGAAKAMMTIPVILDYCKIIEKIAKPTCKLINFTNPSGRVTEAVIKHSNVPIIGLCNVPIGMKIALSENLGFKLDEFNMITSGMNHMFFITDVIKDGRSYLQEAIDSFYSEDAKNDGTPANIDDVPFLENHIRFLNAIPCGYLKYYFLEDEMLRHQEEDIRSGKGVRGEQVKEIEKKLFELYKDPNLNEKPKELEERGGAYYSTVACDTICSIHNDEGQEVVVSVKNERENGEPIIKGLPINTAVEVTCKITKNGPIPLEQPELDYKLLGLLQLMKSYDQLIVEGSVNGNRDAILHALTIHPMVRSGKVVDTIITEMIKINKEYLPQFN